MLPCVGGVCVGGSGDLGGWVFWLFGLFAGSRGYLLRRQPRGCLDLGRRVGASGSWTVGDTLEQWSEVVVSGGWRDGGAWAGDAGEGMTGFESALGYCVNNPCGGRVSWSMMGSWAGHARSTMSRSVLWGLADLS